MVTLPPSTSPDPTEHQLKYQLTVNSYDRTASLIVALLVLVGCTVLGMAVVFFTGKFVRTIEPIPVVPVEATSHSANQGLAEEPDPPGIEEAPDLSEPQLQDTLETLANAITDKKVLLSDEMLDAEKAAGKGKGLGDARQHQSVAAVGKGAEDGQENHDRGGVGESHGAKPAIGAGDFPGQPLHADALQPHAGIGNPAR